jgi:hypothetical protein
MLGSLATLCALSTATLVPPVPADPDQPFAIQVVDRATGRGVPLVELRTTGQAVYVTDSAGRVAFDEPGLMDQDVFFTISSHGYEFPKDGFGIRGARLKTVPGGSARVEIDRKNLAERLYRVTGGGIYRDTVRLGLAAPIAHPVLNAKVMGQDSVLTVVYRGQVHWFWGDTNWPAYPLGDFQSPGAVSKLPGQGGLDPAVGIDLTYFTNPETGFARGTAKMPGDGPTWISGLAVLPDESGRERLYGGYAKIKPPLETYENGVMVWNDDTSAFDRVKPLPKGLPDYPEGHTFTLTEPDGATYLYFARPYPYLRVKADGPSYLDPSAYEGFTCLADGSTPSDPKVDRDEAGAVRYAWKRGQPAFTLKQQEALTKRELLQPGEGLIAMHDVETGRSIHPHGGSVAWNPFLKRWLMLFVEAGGQSSYLGEVYLSTSEAPEGPWAFARKVVTHDKYSFYNPRHHPFLDQDGGRLIHFEGTYVTTFSGNEHPTPYYDYNQVMYRVDLADPRLGLPATDRPNPIRAVLPAPRSPR